MKKYWWAPLTEPFICVFGNESDRAQQVRVAVLLAYGFSLPFNMIYSSVIFGALMILTLLSLTRQKLRSLPRATWIFATVYLLTLSGYFYSYHRDQAGFLLERQLSILLFPLILPLAVRINRPLARLVCHTLFIACVFAVCFLIVVHCRNILFNLRLPASYLMTGAFLNHSFSAPLGIHAGYLSLYVGFSIFYAVHWIGSHKGESRFLFYLALLPLAVGMVFLASRNAMIVTLLVLLAVYPFFSDRPGRYMVYAFSSIVIVVVMLLSVDYLRERFSVFLLEDIGQLQSADIDDRKTIEPRFERWQCAWDLILESPLIGYGTGDEIPMLRYCYIRNGLYLSYLQDYNAHNTFFSILLKHGFIGLSLFVATFIYFVRLALKRKEFLYVGFLCLLLIGFFTENLLDANKGIVFFALFNTLFGFAAIGESTDAENFRTEKQ